MWKRLTIGGVVLGLAFLTSAWLFGWFSSSAAIAEVQQLREKMADPNLKDAEREALREALRTKLGALSPNARRQVFEAGRAAMEKRFEAHIDQILAMSPAERNRSLDTDIDQMQKRQAEFAIRQQSNSASASGAGQKKDGKTGSRTAAITDDQKLNRLRSRLDRSTPVARTNAPSTPG